MSWAPAPLFIVLNQKSSSNRWGPRYDYPPWWWRPTQRGDKLRNNLSCFVQFVTPWTGHVLGAIYTFPLRAAKSWITDLRSRLTGNQIQIFMDTTPSPSVHSHGSNMYGNGEYLFVHGHGSNMNGNGEYLFVHSPMLQRRLTIKPNIEPWVKDGGQKSQEARNVSKSNKAVM